MDRDMVMPTMSEIRKRTKTVESNNASNTRPVPGTPDDALGVQRAANNQHPFGTPHGIRKR